MHKVRHSYKHFVFLATVFHILLATVLQFHKRFPNTEKVSKHTITLHILAISKVLKVSSLRTTPSSSRNPPITFSMPIKNDCAHHFINLNLEHNKIENISLNGYIFDLIYLNKTADQTC